MFLFPSAYGSAFFKTQLNLAELGIFLDCSLNVTSLQMLLPSDCPISGFWVYPWVSYRAYNRPTFLQLNQQFGWNSRGWHLLRNASLNFFWPLATGESRSLEIWDRCIFFVLIRAFILPSHLLGFVCTPLCSHQAPTKNMLCLPAMILNRCTKTTSWITALIQMPSSNLGPGFSSQVSWLRPQWYLTCNGCGQALLLPGQCVILHHTLTLTKAATLSPCSLKFLLISSLLSSFHHYPSTATLPCLPPPLLVSLSPDKLRRTSLPVLRTRFQPHQDLGLFSIAMLHCKHPLEPWRAVTLEPTLKQVKPWCP